MKDVQLLAQHSTITLTMDRYNRLKQARKSAAAKALPNYGGKPAGPKAVAG